MQAKSITYVTSLFVLPALFVFFYVLRLLTDDLKLNQLIPGWYTLAIIFTMIVLERLYRYRYAVSQRSVLARDITSTLVNIYVTGAVVGMILVPAFLFFPELFFGREKFLVSSGQLGPFWLQVLLAVMIVSFFRYWMHRIQHKVPFLWELHSYHHRVTDLKASNLLVSNPIDYALRNVVVFVLLGVIGFDPFAILIGVSALRVSSAFSHCGGDVKGGFLNYIFVTPEVHRWHHSAKVPKGHKYSVNYGVGFIVWDLLFGTFYLPQKDGVAEQPERIGHPSGLPDEPNYLKLLLAPFGLYRPLPWFKRA
jgi:sterol desaturase/sphingolipid hydroxylase (fatty acid hydroxylase superfamily)